MTRTTARQNPSTPFETPTFDARSAFSWTLRGGEMARLERLQGRMPAPVRRSRLARIAALVGA
jgi:hypothetical protein